MTGTQFKTALGRLGLSQAALARIVGVNDRQARRWASGDSTVPRSVELVLRLLLTKKISLSDL